MEAVEFWCKYLTERTGRAWACAVSPKALGRSSAERAAFMWTQSERLEVDPGRNFQLLSDADAAQVRPSLVLSPAPSSRPHHHPPACLNEPRRPPPPLRARRWTSLPLPSGQEGARGGGANSSASPLAHVPPSAPSLLLNRGRCPIKRWFVAHTCRQPTDT